MDAWVRGPVGRGLLLEAQASWMESGHGAAGGQAWVRLLPDTAWPVPDPPARFSETWTVAPGPDGWQGAWRAAYGCLPLARGAVSRVDVRFVLESLPEPEALLAECARVLHDDGRVLVFGMNPFGLARLRWQRQRVRAFGRDAVATMLRAQGLELLAQRTLGPRWRPGGLEAAVSKTQRVGVGRVAWAILAARRSAAPTPLRLASPAWKASAGVPAA